MPALESFESAVAGFLFETHSVPDQVFHDASTSRDPWRLRLRNDVEATIKRTAGFLRERGITERDLVEAAPLHPSSKRLMEMMA